MMDKLYYIYWGLYVNEQSSIYIGPSDEKSLELLDKRLYSDAYEAAENMLGQHGFATFDEDEYESESGLAELEHEAIEDAIEWGYEEFNWEKHSGLLYPNDLKSAEQFLGMKDTLPREKILAWFSEMIVNDHTMKFETCFKYFEEFYSNHILNYVREIHLSEKLTESEYDYIFEEYVYICIYCTYTRDKTDVEIMINDEGICADCYATYTEEIDELINEEEE